MLKKLKEKIVTEIIINNFTSFVQNSEVLNKIATVTRNQQVIVNNQQNLVEVIYNLLNKKYILINLVDDKFMGVFYETEFIERVKKIVEENDDTIKINNVQDAVNYINEYSDNLKLIEIV